MSLDWTAARLGEFRQGVAQSVVADQQQGQVVVGPLVLGVDGDRLPQVHLGIGPAALEVEAVAHVAEDVGVAGFHRQGLAIELSRFAELALLVMDDRQPRVGIGPAPIAVKGGAVGGHCLIEISLLFGGSTHADLNIGLLRRRDLRPAAFRLVPKTQGRGCTVAGSNVLAACQADQRPGRQHSPDSWSST